MLTERLCCLFVKTPSYSRIINKVILVVKAYAVLTRFSQAFIM